MDAANSLGRAVTSALEIAVPLVAQHEGYRRFPYRDTLGIETIGCGRNLRDSGISHSEALVLLSNDLAAIERELSSQCDFWAKLDEVRRAALLDMGMMGVKRLMRFDAMFDAIRQADWERAAHEALASLWAREVKEARSSRIAEMLRTGT